MASTRASWKDTEAINRQSEAECRCGARISAAATLRAAMGAMVKGPGHPRGSLNKVCPKALDPQLHLVAIQGVFSLKYRGHGALTFQAATHFQTAVSVVG